MQFNYHKNFKKRFEKLPVKIQNKFEEHLGLFFKNQFHPILSNHSLSGEYKGCRSINVTGDIRAIFYVKNDGHIVFTNIGSHPELYE